MPEDARNYLDWSDKGRSSFVRYAIGLVTIVLAWFVLGSFLAVPFILFGSSVLAGTAAGETIGKVAAFFLVFVTVPLVTRFVLKRPWWSFGSPAGNIDYWALGVAVGVSVVVSLLTTLLLGVLGFCQLKFQAPDIGQYLLLLVVATVGLFIQTSAEEFMFRGYLTQFVHRYSRHPVVFIGIPTLLFAALHIANIASFGGHWYAMLPYVASGLMYAWFAYRSGSLWMAIGLHWANNLGNAVMVGTDIDVLPSLAPVIISQPTLAFATVVTLSSSAVVVVVLEVLIRRRASAAARP